MGPLNSSSLGAMGSVLKKLDDLRTGDEQAQGLIVSLGTISTNLKILSEVHDPPLTVKFWMTDARELSYDMEVCLDQFVHASQHGAMSSEVASIKEILGTFTVRMEEVMERFERYNLVNRYVTSSSNMDASCRLFSCEFCEKNDGNSPRNDILTDLSQNPLASVTVRPTEVVLSHNLLQNLYMEAEPLHPIGMEDPSKLLDEWLKLKGHGEDDLCLKQVVSVLGDGGVGKSMLVKRLWRASEGKFDRRAFVQMSKKPDMMLILRSILSQVRPKQPSKAFDVRKLIQDIKEHLQDKRYFIIIDDLWDVSAWHIIRRAFPNGNYSIAIITTAVENIAQECCSYDRNNIVNVKRLQEDQSKKLFVDTAFGSAEGFSPQFNDVIDKITRKCGGLPLAITCTARLVGRSQPETEKKQLLDYVNTFLQDNLRTHSSSKEILNQVLKLCYSSLPHCLKTCLLYLSVYPENYSFLKEDLVKQWIAEDFICTQEKKESVALSYFELLLNLGLIQRMDIINSEKKRLLYYTVHPVEFDFITCQSKEENFVRIIDYSQSKMVLTEKIRRLSLHFGGATYATIPVGVGLSQVRTLGFMGLWGCLPSLEKFKLVRVLILHLWGDHGNMRFPLIDICKLLLLRYLQVRCNVTVELPDEVQCLKHLETLEIDAGVEDVPSDIVQHSSLQHVRIGRKTQHRILAQGPITSTKPIFPENLGSKPLPAVQVFELLPPICSFSRLPGWISLLTVLRILEVVVRELGTYGLNHLGKLPVLTVLSLYVRKPAIERTTFHTSTSPFAALEYFKFVSGAMLLNFPEKGMPKLRRLKIRFNARRGEMYSDMLRSIHHLENLQEVVARIGTANGDEDSDFRKAAKSAFEQAIQEVERLRSSGQISHNVKWVDKVDEEYDAPESSKKRGEILEEMHGQDSTEQDENSAKDNSAATSFPLPAAPRRQTQKDNWTRPGLASDKNSMLLSEEHIGCVPGPYYSMTQRRPYALFAQQGIGAYRLRHFC